MNAIEIKNFTKCYKDVKAVDNINFNVLKGEITGFVGENGAGKTTTIRSLLNFINPTSGTLNILGLDCVRQSKEIKSKVSYMSSDTTFYDNLSAKQMFKLACDISNVSLNKALEYATYFDLDVNKKFKTLSLGNSKKVGIIQTLIKDSEIFIFDEPTNGLDPLMQVKFFELILKLKEDNKTIFLSSHNLVEIEKYCDRVIIIKEGKIVEDIDMRTARLNQKQLVTYVNNEGEEVSYQFDGDVNELLADLSKLNLKTLEIKNISMEDEFMKYYGGELNE